MPQKTVDPKTPKPLTDYERGNWSKEASSRGMLMRSIVNPTDRNLLVYYPASGGETIVSRYIGAATQVQVNLDHPVDPKYGTNAEFGGDPRRARRITYKSQWLQVVDYLDNMFQMIPREIRTGMDVLIDKCGEDISKQLGFKEFNYNKIKRDGHLITDKDQHFFMGIPPETMGLVRVLETSGRQSSKGEPFHLQIYQKEEDWHIPFSLFEADALISNIKLKKEGKLYSSSEEFKNANPGIAQQKLKIAIHTVTNKTLADRLQQFDYDFFVN